MRQADEVVTLTEASRGILLQPPDGAAAQVPITVIPCCTDFAAFPPVTAEKRIAARAELGISQSAKVAGYLGSIGTWYLLGEMLDFFAVQRRRDPDARFLFVTRDDPAPIRAAALERDIPAEALVIRPATRVQVPEFMAAADYALFFIKPCFSKLASSPVKLGELLASELPIITNARVGDVDRIMAESGAGVAVKQLTDTEYPDALDDLERLRPDMTCWRAAAQKWAGLDTGLKRYDQLYRFPATDLNRSTMRVAWKTSE